MNCPQCNHEIPEGMKFCPSCGYAVPQKRYCPNCGKELHDGMVFCSSCGTNVTDSPKKKSRKKSGNANSDIVCPICGEPLSIDDCQCPNCHRNLYYKCTECHEDFTYGELIRGKGSCPHCGTRHNGLGNIPDDKYPFYIPPTNQTSNQQSSSNSSQQSQEDESFFSSKEWKFVKYCLIVGIGWIVISFCYRTFSPTANMESKGEKAILNRLRAPSTAKFLGTGDPDKTKAYVEKALNIKIPDNGSVMSFKVEAENGFGGRVTDAYIVFYQDGEPLGVMSDDTMEDGDAYLMLANWGWIKDNDK